MGNNSSHDVTAVEERLLFPAWSGTVPHTAHLHRRLLRDAAWIGVVVLILLVVVSLTEWTRATGTDRVLGIALEVRDANSLGLPKATIARRSLAFSGGNPWRGAGNRRRDDLLSSVSGCGGHYRRKLKRGDSASLYYIVREANGSEIDGSGRDHGVDVVLGSRQVTTEMEKRLTGMCAGETVGFRSTGRSFIVHVARVGSLRPEDEIAQRLELLAQVLKSVRAVKGASCDLTCREKGMRCAGDGFRIINACPRLREVFPCRSCETAAAGSSGPDMPCYVELSAPPGHPRGFCMVNPNVETATCKARYVHTRRLCPCVTQDEK